MRKLLFISLVFGVSINLMAQKKGVNQKGDSTIYFYGTMKLSSGMHVVTKMDSVTAGSDKVVQMLVSINESNKSRILGFARKELGNERLSAKLGKGSNVLVSKGTKNELRLELDKLLRTYDGKVYTLMEFQFTKPESGEASKVKMYEER